MLISVSPLFHAFSHVNLPYGLQLVCLCLYVYLSVYLFLSVFLSLLPFTTNYVLYTGHIEIQIRA